MDSIEIRKEKQISFSWIYDKTQTEVVILIPNTESNKMSSWGDWGPMYEIFLHPSHPIEISYDNEREQEKYKLDISSFHVNTPSEAFVRNQFPLMYVIQDKKKNVYFRLYADATGTIQKVEAIKNEEDCGINYCALKVS